jgi:hypothetical protein
MNRVPSILAAIAFAAAAAAAPVLAQQQTPNPNERTPVAPGKEAMKPAAPSGQSVESLDDTTQRAHDRNRSGAAAGKPAQARAAEDVRDWAAIDKNKDHLIQPEEMEAALNEAWAKGKK